MSLSRARIRPSRRIGWRHRPGRAAGLYCCVDRLSPPPKADIRVAGAERPLCAKSGHSSAPLGRFALWTSILCSTGGASASLMARARPATSRWRRAAYKPQAVFESRVCTLWCTTGCDSARPPLLAPNDAKAMGDWTLVRRDGGSAAIGLSGESRSIRCSMTRQTIRAAMA